MRFWLGTHKAVWLSRLDVPLFVSHRTLRGRKTMPRAVTPWALDSGGFTEIATHHRWTVTEAEYVAAVRRYREEVGLLEWAAPMDWMCEPDMIAKTGLSVAEHQRRTVENYLELRALAPELPFVPVLQGWDLPDYLRCIDLYASAGIDLTAEPLVGIGSVCRRQSTDQIGEIVSTVASQGIDLHGFGVKAAGLAKYGHHLASSDSMSWSIGARYEPPLPGCPHAHCNNCPIWALRWRGRVLAALATPGIHVDGVE